MHRNRYCILPRPAFRGIYLPHYFIGKNYVFAFVWREISLCVSTVKQDSGAIVSEGGFSFGGKTPKP